MSGVFRLGKKIAIAALSQVGKTSVAYTCAEEGNSPEGFDCSGLVQYVIKEVWERKGWPRPRIPGTDRYLRHTEEWLDWFGFLVHREALQPGDLVFFSKYGTRPTHIAVYTSDGNVVHSPARNGSSRNKVETRSIDSLIYPVEYDPECGHPQIYFNNPIAYKRPAVHTPERFQKPV